METLRGGQLDGEAVVTNLGGVRGKLADRQLDAVGLVGPHVVIVIRVRSQIDAVAHGDQRGALALLHHALHVGIGAVVALTHRSVDSRLVGRRRTNARAAAVGSQIPQHLALRAETVAQNLVVLEITGCGRRVAHRGMRSGRHAPVAPRRGDVAQRNVRKRQPRPALRAEVVDREVHLRNKTVERNADRRGLARFELQILPAVAAHGKRRGILLRKRAAAGGVDGIGQRSEVRERRTRGQFALGEHAGDVGQDDDARLLHRFEVGRHAHRSPVLHRGGHVAPGGQRPRRAPAHVVLQHPQVGHSPLIDDRRIDNPARGGSTRCANRVGGRSRSRRGRTVRSRRVLIDRMQRPVGGEAQRHTDIGGFAGARPGSTARRGLLRTSPEHRRCAQQQRSRGSTQRGDRRGTQSGNPSRRRAARPEGPKPGAQPVSRFFAFHIYRSFLLIFCSYLHSPGTSAPLRAPSSKGGGYRLS